MSASCGLADCSEDSFGILGDDNESGAGEVAMDDGMVKEGWWRRRRLRMPRFDSHGLAGNNPARSSGDDRHRHRRRDGT